MAYNILVVNPGSTSDEVGFFRGEEKVYHTVVRYAPGELKAFEKKKVTAQFQIRKDLVVKTLTENRVSLADISAVIGRGGLVRPIPSGTYRVSEKMLNDLRQGALGDHPSNLGGLIAYEIAQPLNVPAFIADPVVVDEMEPLARYSGMPENPRISIFHALNQKRVARLAAAKLGKSYEDCNFIVMHGGGGISVGAHRKGRVIDVNNALDGEGPFTPQRSGGVPSGALARMCFSGSYSLDDIKLKIKGRGGLVAYTGTSDVVALKKYIQGEAVAEKSGLDSRKVSPEAARECLLAMAYQIAKEICALAAVLEGKVDAIVLTGGIVYDTEILMPAVEQRVGWLAPVLYFPGGDEMRALRDAAVSALAVPGSVKEY
ncbi:MAG TPA: butyrate kinase [Elusimicrobia bacterium]|nr:butyrate kinase [Elusimicrobiota bacterium]HBT61391.1 butyrate kinase [Elusimicrobiota bacterium]